MDRRERQVEWDAKGEGKEEGKDGEKRWKSSPGQ